MEEEFQQIQEGIRASGDAAMARDALRRTEMLRADVEKLFLLVQALWSFLREQGRTEEELLRRMEEIDLADGRLDNRVRPGAPRKCPHCGRTLIRHGRPVCLYCGAEAPPESAFDH